MNFLVTDSVSANAVIIIVPVLCIAIILIALGLVYHVANKLNCTFQMLGPTRGRPEGRATTMRVVAGRSSRQALRKSWPHKLSCSANFFKGSKLLGFLGTQSALFNRTEEPLDADAWLRTIESKFSLLQVPCSEASKARFAAQQLRGSARL